MSNSEWGGQTTRESALAEMRKLATEDVNRVLRDVETRKQGLIRAVKARALGVARGFIDRINKGLDDAAATVKVLEDTDFVERLESIKLLADFLKGMVPEGAGQQVAQEDIDGLVDLAESIVIPSVYEPKFASESSENSESSPESGSIIPHEEVRGVESIPVSEKVEPPPSAPAVEVIEKVSENLELTDVAPSTASPSTTPSQLNVAEPVGLSTEGNDNLPAAESTVLPLATLAEEEDNLPPEAAKFKDTLRVERMDRRPKSRDIDEDTSQKDPGQKTKVKTAVPSVPPPNGTPRPLPDDRQDFQTRIRPVPVPDLSHLAGLEVELDKIPRRSTRTKTYQELLAKNQPRVDAVVESRREESAASSGPNLEEIIAEVSAAVKRGEGKEFLLVPEEEEYV
ncbi:MAG: hypothetical protein Q7S86_03340, partial [bacterium]|nr:hypothetical protein [bacterium]